MKSHSGDRHNEPKTCVTCQMTASLEEIQSTGTKRKGREGLGKSVRAGHSAEMTCNQRPQTVRE